MKYILLLSLIFPLSVYPHETVLPADCPMPGNTGRITSQIENEMFQAELILFERCMFDYIRNQQQFSDVHQQAAQLALDEWNDYLTTRIQEQN